MFFDPIKNVILPLPQPDRWGGGSLNTGGRMIQLLTTKKLSEEGSIKNVPT